MKFPRFLPSVISTVAASALALSVSTSARAEDFYVGTYTHFFGSQGIYHFQFDPKTGAISGGELAVKTVNPSFLAIDASRHRVYACNENKVGSISAFTIAPDRQLKFINSQSSKGGWPCHVSFDANHRYLFTANYMDGVVAVFPIERGGGIGAATSSHQHQGKGPNAERQEGPHAHSIYADPANRFVYSCDLGNDHVEGYRFNPGNGTITPSKIATTKIAPGSGPRHLVLDPRGYVYVINELTSTVTVLRRDEATGAMHTLQTISSRPSEAQTSAGTIPNRGSQMFAAEIALSPNGKSLYVSNRGLDRRSISTIAVFRVAPDGRLSLAQQMWTRGQIPRHFSLDPSGHWMLVANQKSGDIFVFAVNSRTGELTPTGGRLRIGTPACVAFMPTK
jgi:6-phosphogluconolactonase